jgi:GntR family transcriptional regulator/MocR family aminotransferase
MKDAGGYTLGSVTIDRAATLPLQQQVYESLRGAILARKLRAGMRLPSTRSLAGDLGVSRNTVLAAFEQLTAEGYLDSKTGSGTYVAAELPDELLSVRRRPLAAAVAPATPRLSRRASELRSSRINVMPVKPRAFRSGIPALDVFPARLWARLVAQQWAKVERDRSSLGYGASAGLPQLRAAVARYVGAARGVQCDAEQVIITSGLQHGLQIAAHVLIDAGDPVWFEDPGYPAARAALAAEGARITDLPVSDDGLDVAKGLERCPDPRLIYVTPSHQYPLGVTMTVARRLQLLDAARRADAWIIEDDYDGEYRHSTRPVPSIQGLDSHNRVIYVGSFSKVLYPAIRLGFLIVPSQLVDTFVRARSVSGRASPLIDQAVVAEFIDQGHFERHIRRMRAVYRQRQEALLDAADRYLRGLATVARSEAGMHTIAWLHEIDDQAATRAARDENIEVTALSSFTVEHRLPPGLILGYGGVTPRQIRAGAEALARALERVRRLRIA